MLFLLKPNGSLVWTDMPKSILDVLVNKDRDYDLNQLEWKPSEFPVSDITVRLALREGHVVKDGILIDAGPVLIEERPTKLLSLHIEAEKTYDRLEETPSYKMTEDFLEAQAPGWKADSKKTRAAVVETMEKSISRAQAELDTALAQPVNPGVVEHWRSLGGYMPNEDSQP